MKDRNITLAASSRTNRKAGRSVKRLPAVQARHDAEKKSRNKGGRARLQIASRGPGLIKIWQVVLDN